MNDGMSSGAVCGAPRLVLHLEAAAVLAVAAVGYAETGASWWFFAALFLVPDLSMLGYMAGALIGAAAYNLGHTYIVPVVILGVGLAMTDRWLVPIALIWIAHIGFDRMVGYGLKYASGFGDTHLGRQGKAASG